MSWRDSRTGQISSAIVVFPCHFEWCVAYLAYCSVVGLNGQKGALMSQQNFLKQTGQYQTLQSAWERVAENRGCAGSDGVSIERYAVHLQKNLRDLSHSLASQTYHPFPLLRFPVPKRSGQGQRFLSVPTVRDRVAQTSAFVVTKHKFEAEFEDVSHGFREGRGVRTAVYDIKTWRDKGYRFAVDADIDDYFDSVPHDILLQKLKKLFNEAYLIQLFEKWIKAEIYDGQRIWTLEKGIPQGSVVSPHLANLLLDELDETLLSFGMKLVRFADDFLILCKTRDEAQEAIEVTDMALDDLELDLNPLKTKIVSFDQGFKFLGAVFLYDGIYLPWPKARKPGPTPRLPPPLTLRRYLELKNK